MPKNHTQKIHQFDLGQFPKGAISEVWHPIISNGIGEPIRIPIMVARGNKLGPTVGLTAALHGNELNGIPVVQKLFEQIDTKELCGNIVGILIANVPGVLLGQRKFNDNVDLNWVAPGKSDGNESEIYINRIIEEVIKHCNYLIDLHTVSFGRASSHYILADMSDPKTAKMALLQNPAIIINQPPSITTLRGQAAGRGIKTITAELKDPHLFQEDVIQDATVGIKNVLCDLGMQPGEIVAPTSDIVQCKKAQWLHTDEGGLLTVYPEIGQWLKQGDLIAELKTVFNRTIKKYHCPQEGIVIAKSVNPIAQTGGRTIHLGVELDNVTHS
jgi:uncharacterized protein